MSQRQLADALGFKSPVYLCAIESGSKLPSPRVAIKIASILGLDVVEFNKRIVEERIAIYARKTEAQYAQYQQAVLK